MYDFKPTRAKTVVFTNGHMIACTEGPIVPTESSIEPCLILPAWRPIAECPKEWKDGRWVWLFDKGRKRWIEGWWSVADNPKGWATIPAILGGLTHVMLPPPEPEEHA